MNWFEKKWAGVTLVNILHTCLAHSYGNHTGLFSTMYGFIYVCVCILLCQLLLKSVLIRKIRNSRYYSSVDRIFESKMNELKAKRDKELFLLRCISFLLLLNCLMGCFRLFSFVCVYQGLGTLTNSMYSVHCTLCCSRNETKKKTYFMWRQWVLYELHKYRKIFNYSPLIVCLHVTLHPFYKWKIQFTLHTKHGKWAKIYIISFQKDIW